MKQPKKPRGRPLGGKSDPTLRNYWRLTKQDYRVKMKSCAKKDLNQSRRKPR